MPTAKLFNMAGDQVGEVALSEAVFGVEPNESVLHDSVKNHLANCRQGTQSALTKGEVSYSTAKPWRQKGTGRARSGMTLPRCGVAAVGEYANEGRGDAWRGRWVGGERRHLSIRVRRRGA